MEPTSTMREPLLQSSAREEAAAVGGGSLQAPPVLHDPMSRESTAQPSSDERGPSGAANWQTERPHQESDGAGLSRQQAPEVELTGCCRPGFALNWEDFW